MHKAKIAILFLMSALLVGCASSGQNEVSQRKVDAFLNKTQEQLEDFITAEEGKVNREEQQVIVILSGDKSFRHGSSEVRTNGLAVLEKISNYLSENQKSTIFVVGHTDSTGSAEFNQQLSEDRALAVTEFFISQGIDSKRVNSFGVGEWSPIASNEQASGRQENRRIEVRITPKFDLFK
ncbi:OmpA family protein [Photobacterium kasasachensis]|uniref:OmpA family protein n=1 Tax=Photobacterium kasasachensis TaxID=2910240 RepID=UPI003D113904